MQPELKDQWYFAYGSNLDIDQKKGRTGTIGCAKRTGLADYRFAFNKRGSAGNIYANIVPSLSSVVWGVSYLCCPDAIAKMNKYEGTASGHYLQKTVVVECDDGTSIEAITYVAGDAFTCPDVLGIRSCNITHRMVTLWES
ncbi:MAG: gamma-glutamylcyclotransferase [Nitrospirales bacterium]|nr:gamma-glutamylcyclotransferase [Nitrospirales bacterium]